MLGLKDDVTKIKVDSISNEPFKAPTLEQPNLNTTTTQQVVNNDSNREVAAEEHASSSTTTGLTEQLPEVNSTQELSTPNNEPVKIDTSDQPKSLTTDMVVEQADTPNQLIPSAVPNEPQETLVNAHEEKGKPNNTASNEEVQPGVSNEEVTIESEELFDAEEDNGVTQPSLIDPAVEQSIPVSSSKALTNGTLPKVASPVETKNGSNNGAVVLYQMPHDARRTALSDLMCKIPHGSKLYFHQLLENFLLSKSLVREMLFYKVAPNSLLVQTREEQAASNDLSHKSQSL